MKEIIIIFATIILGVYIGITLINGDKDSLRSGADSMSDKINTRIENLVDNDLTEED